MAKEFFPEMLPEAEALILIRELARFHEVIHLSEQQLEACVIATYLFHLWYVTILKTFLDFNKYFFK